MRRSPSGRNDKLADWGGGWGVCSRKSVGKPPHSKLTGGASRGRRRIGDERAIGAEIEDDLEPPVGLIANLDGNAAKIILRANQYGEGDGLAGPFVLGDKIKLQEIGVGSIEKDGAVGAVELDREYVDGSDVFNFERILLGIMDVAARKWSSLAGEGRFHKFGDGGEKRGRACTAGRVIERANWAIGRSDAVKHEGFGESVLVQVEIGVGLQRNDGGKRARRIDTAEYAGKRVLALLLFLS